MILDQGEIQFLVQCSMVTFNPFCGEVLTAKIMSSCKTGLRLSMGFFGNILILSENISEDTLFEPHTSTWVWLYESITFRYDVGETVRFRVISTEYSGNLNTNMSTLTAKKQEDLSILRHNDSTTS